MTEETICQALSTVSWQPLFSSHNYWKHQGLWAFPQKPSCRITMGLWSEETQTRVWTFV